MECDHRSILKQKKSSILLILKIFECSYPSWN